MFDSDVELRAVEANQGVAETVAWLQRWCPGQARAFALAMHELAAWQYDDSRIEHWHSVVRQLPTN